MRPNLSFQTLVVILANLSILTGLVGVIYSIAVAFQVQFSDLSGASFSFTAGFLLIGLGFMAKGFYQSPTPE